MPKGRNTIKNGCLRPGVFDLGSKQLDESRNENHKLQTIIDSLLQEKEEQSKEINEIKDHLANERMANQRLLKDLNKTRQKLSKLQVDFDEEKVINKQLLDNQQQLKNEMEEKNNVKKFLFIFCLY
jgi:predicted outer membrane protein